MSIKAKQPNPSPKGKQPAPDPKSKQPDPVQQAASANDVEDYSNEMIFQPETNSYSLVLRWKPLSHLEMIGLAVHLSIKDRIVDTLDVDYCNFDARGMIGLANVLRNNNTITSISMGHNSLGPLGAQRIAVALRENTSLEYLNLEWNDIGSEGIVFITKALSANKGSKLKVLDIHSNKIDEEGAIALGEYIESNTTLNSAVLRFNPIGDKGGVAIAKSFSKNVTLKAIDFARCGVGDGTMEALRQAFREASAQLLREDYNESQRNPKKRTSDITAILLEHNDLGPAGLESLSNALLESAQTHRIEQLSLYDCRNIDHVGPVPNVDGIKIMGSLLASEESALTNLDLGSCNLDDCGVQALSDSLSTAPRLKFINLQKNKLTNISAMSLRDALKTNNVLEEIDLRANKFSDDGMSAFVELLSLNNTLKDVDIRGIALQTINPQKLKNEIYPKSRIEILKWVDKKQNVTADEISELRKKVLYDPTPRKITQARSMVAQQQPDIQRVGSNSDLNIGTPQRLISSSSVPNFTALPAPKTAPKPIAPGQTKAAKK